MPISRISLWSLVNLKRLDFDLNVIQQGWVAQIIEGTFGDKTSFSFTDGNLTSVESSTIDINVRLTPVVTITERTPESILNFLAGVARKSEVTITDTDIPGLSIKYTTQNDVSTATLSEAPTSSWSQACIVREIKYNYSANPATIEFTISTTRPFLRGSVLDFYYKLKNTPKADSYSQFNTIFNRLTELNVQGDIEGLALALPPGYKGNSETVSVNNFPYKIYVRTEDATKPCEAWIQTSAQGRKSFSFVGGANSITSYAYIEDAYPMFSANVVREVIANYGDKGYQMGMPIGKASSWVRFVHMKRGL